MEACQFFGEPNGKGIDVGEALRAEGVWAKYFLKKKFGRNGGGSEGEIGKSIEWVRC